MRIKGMVQVSGTTYRIVRLERGYYEAVRLLDDARVGTFKTLPSVNVVYSRVDASLMLSIARAAVMSGKTSWTARVLPVLRRS